MNPYPNILTIAGSDSGGGAGIQADLKTITVLKCYGMSVITSLTAQNGLGVTGIHAVPADFVSRQYTTVQYGFKIAAAKTGMLCNEEIMLVMAPALKQRDFPLVVDPVCVSQAGNKLVEDSAFEILQNNILPLADLITPNLFEAKALAEMEIDDEADVKKAMQVLQKKGAKAVLLKGGHCRLGMAGSTETTITDWLLKPNGDILPLSHPRIDTENNHGTGCTLSAAVATFLGLGFGLEEAVRNAQDFLVCALEASFNPGKGRGPVNFEQGAQKVFDKKR